MRVIQRSLCTNPRAQDTIDTYHRQSGVIMDVVIITLPNRWVCFWTDRSCYFYRYNARRGTNGTFCKWHVDERSMVRHYIKQSLKQWVSLYGFDGFALTLDRNQIQTMTETENSVKSILTSISMGKGGRWTNSEDQLVTSIMRTITSLWLFSVITSGYDQENTCSWSPSWGQHSANDFVTF